MKVICIDDEFYNGKGIPDTSIRVGDVFTVKQTRKAYKGITVYEFEEISGGWDVEQFAPISEIDETEMERDYKLIEQLNK